MTAASNANSIVAERSRFLGLDFDLLTLDQTLSWIGQRIGRPGFAYVVTPNVDHVVRYSEQHETDGALEAAYRDADLLLCDSRILGLLADASGRALPIVAGSDLTHRLVAGGGPWQRMAVVGGDPRLHAKLAAAYPGYDWSFHEPPFGVRTNPDARAAIRRFVEDAQADIVFFAIGAPQSEICCHEIAAGGSARGVGLCIGASLEFLTGTKQRAPRWMQAARLEWLHRLLSEPGRLWRRYLIEGPKILRIWWRHRS